MVATRRNTSKECILLNISWELIETVENPNQDKNDNEETKQVEETTKVEKENYYSSENLEGSYSEAIKRKRTHTSHKD